jgi:hypothetical protein
LSLVNFIERTGYGSLRLIWPIIPTTSDYCTVYSHITETILTPHAANKYTWFLYTPLKPHGFRRNIPNKRHFCTFLLYEQMYTILNPNQNFTHTYCTLHHDRAATSFCNAQTDYWGFSGHNHVLIGVNSLWLLSYTLPSSRAATSSRHHCDYYLILWWKSCGRHGPIDVSIVI